MAVFLVHIMIFLKVWTKLFINVKIVVPFIFVFQNLLRFSFSILIKISLPVVYFTFVTHKDSLQRGKQWEKKYT